MKRTLYRFGSVFCLGVLIVSAVGYAQSRIAQQASIPFDFYVGDTRLQPGEYVVQGTNSQAVLQLSAKQGQPSVFVMTNAKQRGDSSAKGVMVFHRYGNYHFLSEVWGAGKERGHVLIPSKTERRIASIQTPDEEVQVALR